jgi:hypothetical protein
MRRTRLVWPATAVAGLAYGAVLVFFRGSPSLVAGDLGTFVTVAARLLHGDRLYADVLDNKDPLFFYADALALRIGGWRGPAALDAVWLGIAATSMAGFLFTATRARWAAVAGFVVYPLLLTSAWYGTGLSQLAALSLAPLIGWLAACRRWFLAGAVVGVAALFKSNLGLVLIAAPAALLVQSARGTVLRTLAKLGAGIGAALGIVASVMAVRGELVPYLGVLHENVLYSSDALAYQEQGKGVQGHLGIVTDMTPHLRRLEALVVLAAALAVWMRVRAARPARPREEPILALVLVVVGAAVFVTLALTAIFPHHMQMVAYFETLLLVYLATAISALVRARAGGLAICAAAVVCLAGLWLLGGTEHPALTPSPATRWSAPPLTLTANALEQAAAAFPMSSTISYARIGWNDDGHAAFLDDRFDLACPRFQQLRYIRPFGSVLTCLEEKKPELIVTAPPFSERDPRNDRWTVFVRRSRILLARSYLKVEHMDTRFGSLDVWRRR